MRCAVCSHWPGWTMTARTANLLLTHNRGIVITCYKESECACISATFSIVLDDCAWGHNLRTMVECLDSAT